MQYLDRRSALRLVRHQLSDDRKGHDEIFTTVLVNAKNIRSPVQVTVRSQPLS